MVAPTVVVLSQADPHSMATVIRGPPQAIEVNNRRKGDHHQAMVALMMADIRALAMALAVNQHHLVDMDVAQILTDRHLNLVLRRTHTAVVIPVLLADHRIHMAALGARTDHLAAQEILTDQATREILMERGSQAHHMDQATLVILMDQATAEILMDQVTPEILMDQATVEILMDQVTPEILMETALLVTLTIPVLQAPEIPTADLARAVTHTVALNNAKATHMAHLIHMEDNHQAEAAY